MVKNRGMFRIRIEHEEFPMVDAKVFGLDGLDDTVKQVKKKIR